MTMFRNGMLASAGLGVLMTAGVALAQVPPPPPADGAPAQGQADQAGPGGEMRHGGSDRDEMHEHHGPGMMRMMMGMHRPPPPSKAAHFRFRKGDGLVDIKCADDETMKACVDAGSALLDKLAPPAR